MASYSHPLKISHYVQQNADYITNHPSVISLEWQLVQNKSSNIEWHYSNDPVYVRDH